MIFINKLIEKPFFSALGIIGLIFTIIVVFTFSESDHTQGVSGVEDSSEYAIYMVKLPVDIDFAGEEVPLEYFDVAENLDREIHVNTYWHSQTLLFFKRANRYFPVIEKILEENDIPDDFKYLALIESGLTNIISPAGATGFWQFLKGTAKEYGLEVNNEIDERYHIEKSTLAACKYLKKSFKKYGNWTMAAASYNLGKRNLDKQVERQKTNYYYDLLLGEETERYLFRILAAKYILSDPANYGFHFVKKDLYKQIPHYYIKIDTSIESFTDLAYEHSINYKTLKYFNPWLRENYLTNSNKKEYVLKIPKKGYRKYNKQGRIIEKSGE